MFNRKHLPHKTSKRCNTGVYFSVHGYALKLGKGDQMVSKFLFKIKSFFNDIGQCVMKFNETG